MTTTANAVGAASHHDVGWHDINWRQAHRTVRRLQVRIAKAVSEGGESLATVADVLILWQSCCRKASD